MVHFQSMVRRITRWTSFGAMFLLLPMMLLSATDVTLRRFFTTTIPGTMELSSYMLALFILLGLSYTHQCKAHVKVSFLLDLLPLKVRTVVDIVLSFLCLMMLLVLSWQGFIIAIEETTVSDMLRIPENPFRMALVVGCLSFSLEVIVDIISQIQALRGN
ncbi:TRAP transporter small permease subunit [Desulforhopalus singaporensis]|uniref:TRAP-type mannitol/chloroaromatic compound transport system, small permease component n=1 Tax=Desulforhopalus singaporensis TaxID=91360 RepID=A0A1H0N6V4_9BACT|nr:TRAP transporter small permease [Desulforhopalus singaporensis]SDO88090.1 TRAP-type mannitol/chloroaromatic compound transport system, small permease component [Desulforhopalus singaporensis]